MQLHDINEIPWYDGHHCYATADEALLLAYRWTTTQPGPDEFYATTAEALLKHCY